VSVQELGALHARYVDLSGRFKAAWTFHQFLQGLQNLSVEPELGKYRVDFQVAHGALKDLSQNLTAGAVDKLQLQIEFAARQLAAPVEALVNADAKISPSLLRQFFDRVKNSDEKILAQMVRFYIYAARDGRWTGDRVDKVDFLVTKLAEQPQNASQQVTLRESSTLRETFAAFWTLAQSGPVSGVDVERRRREVEAVKDEATRVSSLDELNQRGVVQRYRDLKHVLGALFFEPALLFAIVDTNLALKNSVRRFYRVEEQRIVSDYQQVVDLESQVQTNGQLDQELSEYRQEVDKFEKKQRNDDVKLDEMLQIKRRAESLLPRLAADREASGAPAPASPAEAVSPRAKAPVSAATLTSNDQMLANYFRRMVEVLEGTDRNASPKTITVAHEVFSLRLEPREVESYRRLAGAEPCDRDLEQFLFESAALRMRINEEAEEITSLLDETSVTRDSPVFASARLTTRLADAFVQRFQHLIEQSVQYGKFAEAQSLQLLRMRLVRDYSGLWLLVNRPTSRE